MQFGGSFGPFFIFVGFYFSISVIIIKMSTWDFALKDFTVEPLRSHLICRLDKIIPLSALRKSVLKQLKIKICRNYNKNASDNPIIGV